MVKHNKTICRLLPTNCLSVFDHFVRLVLKGLMVLYIVILYSFQVGGYQVLTLSWRKSLLYRNQSIDLQCKSMDWFLHDRDLRRERVKRLSFSRKQLFNFRIKVLVNCSLLPLAYERSLAFFFSNTVSVI